MDRLITEVSAGVDAAPMMGHLEEFATREKLSGTGEELQSFHYLRATLESYGLQPRLIFHDAYVSLPGKARLAIGRESPDCITHSFSRPSGEAGVTGEVVYAGLGRPADFARLDVRGRIVLLDGIANPGASLRASRAGAVGQIHVSPLPHLYEMCISPVWGSPTPEQLALLPTTVVVTVRRAYGDGLKARLVNGERIEATLHAEVDTRWRKTPILEVNVEAAGAEDDSFVLFSGHHDTWHYGVMDNGSANAVMLEAARLFAPRRATLRRHLRLCFWSGHSHGRYSGSSWYADAKFAELARACVAHVNIDSVGAVGNTVLSDALSSHELFEVGAEAVRVQGGEELAGHRMSRAGDQSFWGIGIPSLFMAMGEEPVGGENVMGSALGGAGNRKGAGFGWWWHTPDDTLDKIDADLLVRDARIYMHAIARLLTDPVVPLDVARQAEGLRDALASLGERIGARLDLSATIKDISALRDAALAARDGTSRPPAVNRALIAATRALVPIDYTTGNRFDPDPALGQNPYPVLDALRALADTAEGSDESRFAAVAARRALNRVAMAVDEARAAFAALA